MNNNKYISEIYRQESSDNDWVSGDLKVKLKYPDINIASDSTSSELVTSAPIETGIDILLYNNIDGMVKQTVSNPSLSYTFNEINQLTASDAHDNDWFGRSVALSQDGLVAIVGAYTEDTAGNEAGKVYTYKRASIDDPWTEVNQLIASDAHNGDRFGVSVALSQDGLVAMVGAYHKDTAGTNAGKVYTYKRASIDDPWTEVNQLTASDAQNGDSFGASTALSQNGLVAIVGTHCEDTAGTNAGKVYTYKRDTIDDPWTEVNQLTASDAHDGDKFGIGVALSGDGLVAMVGAFLEDTTGTDAGKVYTYKRDTIDDPWTEVNQLTASDTHNNDNFGISVALSKDGLVAIVGAFFEDTAGTDAGKVYIYKRASIDDPWTEVNQLTASDAQNSDYFGISVALSKDGLVAIVGAFFEDTAGSNAGKVYTYKRNSEFSFSISGLTQAPEKAWIYKDTKITLDIAQTEQDLRIQDIELIKESSSTTQFVGTSTEDIKIKPGDILLIDNSEIVISDITKENNSGIYRYTLTFPEQTQAPETVIVPKKSKELNITEANMIYEDNILTHDPLHVDKIGKTIQYSIQTDKDVIIDKIQVDLTKKNY